MVRYTDDVTIQIHKLVHQNNHHRIIQRSARKLVALQCTDGLKKSFNFSGRIDFQWSPILCEDKLLRMAKLKKFVVLKMAEIQNGAANQIKNTKIGCGILPIYIVGYTCYDHIHPNA